MIKVVFADRSPSKLGLLVRQPETPPGSGDSALASALLFAVLDRAADGTPAMTEATPGAPGKVQTGKPHK